MLDTYAEVLEANLVPVIDDRVETRMKRYCRRYEIEPELLVRAHLVGDANDTADGVDDVIPV